MVADLRPAVPIARLTLTNSHHRSIRSAEDDVFASVVGTDTPGTVAATDEKRGARASLVQNTLLPRARAIYRRGGPYACAGLQRLTKAVSRLDTAAGDRSWRPHLSRRALGPARRCFAVGVFDWRHGEPSGREVLSSDLSCSSRTHVGRGEERRPVSAAPYT